jgi:hypothetical protein
MYMDRVYRLQIEFCEISQMLERAQKPEDRHQLCQRRLEIVAEASELVYELDAGIPIHRMPASSSRMVEAVGVSSE